MTNEGICLDALETFGIGKQSSLARIVNCADTVRQKWLYDLKMQHIVQQTSGNCLSAAPNIQNASHHIVEHGSNIAPNMKNKERKFTVNSAPCMENMQQKWMLFPFEWK